MTGDVPIRGRAKPLSGVRLCDTNFEPHTDWISEGKAGVPIDLGLRVAMSKTNPVSSSETG